MARYDTLPKLEADFFANSPGFDLSELTVPFNNKQESITFTVCERSDGDESFYYKTVHAKKRILLHFTAGYLTGDVNTMMTKGSHVSVPFVVARNGKILNLWTSKYWAYHLGPTASGGNQPMSASSVAIEISNIGPLIKVGNELHTIYSSKYKPAGAKEPQIYCLASQTEAYVAESYRGFAHFATFTDAQIESTIKLVRFLTGRYGIPREFLPESSRYEKMPNPASFNGILSHVNFRADKSDIGPAFPWDRVIAGVKA